MTIHTQSPTYQRLLDETLTLAPDQPHPPYLYQAVAVPPHASRVGATVRFYKTERRTQLFASLFAPDGFRGCRMAPGQLEEVVLELWSTPADASEGVMPGALPAGEWRVQLDIHVVAEPLHVQVVIYAEFDEIVAAPTPIDFPADHVVKAEAGWYKGELHAHSTESDGKHPVDTVIRAALDTGLDFFSLTDHYTVSQWRKLIPHLEAPMALIRSCEVTSHHGHANLHGMTEWVDVFVDTPAWTMNDVADAIHAQGGLFCVNHPFSGILGWRTFDFDWAKADLLEVYVMALPDAGSELKWIDTVAAPDIEGQGIAWDRSSDEPVLYGILRPESQIIQMSVPVQESAPTPEPVGVVHGPGEMVTE